MKKILLIIDVQQGFITDHSRGLPERIAAFLEQKQDEFQQIIFFKFHNDRGSNWVQELEWRGMLGRQQTQLAVKLQPYAVENNTFVKKAAFSVFRVKSFLGLLKKKKQVELYLSGLDTHACIYQSAMEAFERGYRVRVIADLCAASHGREFHDWAIKALQKNLGPQAVIDSKDFL